MNVFELKKWKFESFLWKPGQLEEIWIVSSFPDLFKLHFAALGVTKRSLVILASRRSDGENGKNTDIRTRRQKFRVGRQTFHCVSSRGKKAAIKDRVRHREFSETNSETESCYRNASWPEKIIYETQQDDLNKFLSADVSIS